VTLGVVWYGEKLGDVDVAVNQGSVDPKTMIVKCQMSVGAHRAST
jgi:hypothetical protein